MTVARGPILNPGIYWIDSHPTKAGLHFNDWLRRNKGLASVISTALHIDEEPPRDWVLFEVKFPTPWTADDARQLGFPSVAPKGRATTEADSRDNPETPGFDLSSLFSGTSGLLVLAGLLWFVNDKKL